MEVINIHLSVEFILFAAHNFGFTFISFVKIKIQILD